MPILGPHFGEMKTWRTLPNGLRILRGVFYGGNTDYEAYRGEELVGEFHVERYHPVEGNWGKIGSEEHEHMNFHLWMRGVKALPSKEAAAS